MSTTVKKYACRTVQFCSGGAAYGIIELLWRGYTHLSMLILGGICFRLLIRISKTERRLAVKSFTGGVCITVAEFLTGCVVNLWLGLSVWDYTKEPCQLMGQVCIRFFLLWTFACFAVIPLCQPDTWRKILRLITRKFPRVWPLRHLETVLHGMK